MTQSGTSLLQELLPLLRAGDHLKALDSLCVGLTQLRGECSSDEWREICIQSFSGEDFRRHPLSRLLENGALGSRSAGTAHGLIHEPLILDVIYGFAKVRSCLAMASDLMGRWELAQGFCKSLRARYQLFVRELNDLAHLVEAPRILAVGCGHLREAASALSLESMRACELVAFDRDRACLDLIRREYDHPGLRTVAGCLRDLTKEESLGQFDFIYVPTLLDTMDDARGATLLESLLSLLKAGGRLLAANFAPDLEAAAYLEACVDWWPHYRGEQDLAALLARLSGHTLRGQVLFREDSGGSVLLDLQVI